jgi:hypothetical protein
VITTFLPADPTTDEGKASVWEYRFLLAKLTALTGVLAAVVAFPLTVVRLRLSREDSETTKDSLYNDKINAALSDLHAQRQVTLKENGARETVWQDDIIRRAGAIDRLEALAHERPAMAPRIAAMLCVYVRELSREVPPVARPEDATPYALREWATTLNPNRRSDMEKATQAIGRLALVEGMTPELLKIDLRNANLQGFDLSGLNLNNAILANANLEGAILAGTQLEDTFLALAHLEGAGFHMAHLERAFLGRAHLEGAILVNTHLEGAHLGEAHLEGAFLGGTKMVSSTVWRDAHTKLAAWQSVNLVHSPISEDHVNSAFGDASVTLPTTIPRPKHWAETVLEDKDFVDEWHLWQSDPTTYVPPQHRD